MQYVSHPRSASVVFPRVLFKGVSPKHIESLLTHGMLRVGTLSDYRQIESPIPDIQDPDEGLRTIRIDSFQADDAKTDCLPYPLNALGMFPPGSIASLDMRRCTYGDESPDLYVVSTSLTLEAAKVMYGAGVCILDPIAFGHAIGTHLTTRGLAGYRSLIAGKCVYVPKEQLFTQLHSVPLVFQKPSDLEAQHEFRFAWSPCGGARPVPVIERIPNLTGMIERAW